MCIAGTRIGKLEITAIMGDKRDRRNDDLHEKATGKGDREADRTREGEESRRNEPGNRRDVRVKIIINGNLNITCLCVAI